MVAIISRPLELDLLCEKLHADYGARITGTGGDENARRSNFFSKAVAAFVLREEAGASLDEAVAASIDGGNDHGIDSVFIAGDHTIWLVQSKYIDSGAGEPALGDVSKFRDGVADLLHGRLERFNDAMRNHQAALTNALNNEVCKIQVVLAHTGGAIHDDRRHIFDDLEHGFNSTNPGFVRCRALGLTALHELHLSGASAAPIDAEVELKDFGYTEAPYRAFYGRMNVKRLVELWNAHREKLVERNIRRFKGATRVNEGMNETLKNEPAKFFYFNNGVTFLCQSISHLGNRDTSRSCQTFRVRGMSIINGAQTVGAIAREPLAYYDDNPAEVLTTFICLEKAPDDFGDQVTLARNRQNNVDLEDFAALDERQDTWQDTLRLAGITYLVKQGDGDAPASSTCFSVRELAPFLACTVSTADWPHYVVAAKSDKKKLFGREGFLSSQDPLRKAYDTLFADSLTVRRMWRIVQVGRSVIETVKARSASEPDPAGLPAGTLLAKDILANAGWLILHAVFIRQKSLLDGAELNLTDPEKQSLSRDVDLVVRQLVTVVQSERWGKQARAVFENKTDCQKVKMRLMAALAQRN